jgi:transposase, IS5 family
LKRAYGLARCTWRGLDQFKAYVWSSVVAYNLARSRASRLNLVVNAIIPWNTVYLWAN